MVQKKGVRSANLKEEGSSSMMVRKNEDVSEDEGGSAETELYNLMRGHTSLMITENADDSEESGGSGDSEGESEEDD